MSPHSRFAQNKTILKALSAMITLAVGPPALGYDLATDLICTGCVQTTDIAKNAVGTAKLKNNSVGALKIKDGNVTTAKIKNGAVTYDKLAPALNSLADRAAAYDYRNYVAGSGNVTQKTFELLGDFGDCGGVGAPDTELRNITSANLGGGITEWFTLRGAMRVALLEPSAAEISILTSPMPARSN